MSMYIACKNSCVKYYPTQFSPTNNTDLIFNSKLQQIAISTEEKGNEIYKGIIFV